jgi:hypothetical protein
MLTLGARTTLGSYARLEGYINEPLNFTLQFSDIENIQSPAGSYSQTFTLPNTAANRFRFGDIFQAGYIPEGTENGDLRTTLFKKRFPAAILDKESPIIEGYMQVKGMKKTGDREDIEVVFFADSLDIAKAVGDKQLTDLDLSSYNHTLDTTNIQNSWIGALYSGDVRYGLIDKGFNWNLTDNPPWTSTDGIWQGELTPFVRARTLVDQIFSDAGLTYVSDFFDSTDFGNIYLPAYNGSPTPIATDTPQSEAAVALPSNLTSTSGTDILALSDTANNAVDEDDNWNNTTHRYTVPYSGIYTIRATYSYFEDAVGGGGVEMFIYKNGSQIFELPTDFIKLDNGQRTLTLYLVAGDLIDMRGRIFGSGSHIIYGNNYVGNGVRTQLHITSGDPLSGQTIDLAANLPELKQIDLLLSLQKMFNLVFIPSGLKGQLIIEPFDDYFDTGDELNWDERVHRDKTISMYPTTDIQARRYDWTYKEGLDFISDAVQKSLDRVYGAYRVLDPDNDFATGEKSLKTELGNYVISLIPGSNFPIHRSLQADGSAIQKPLAMLAYWGGLVTSFGGWYLRDNSGTTIGPSSSFPLFSPYSADYPTLTDNDLNFGMEASFIPQDCNPLNTLYYKYWKGYIRELYSEESRILECTIKLPLIEVITWKWNKKVYINGAWWRILSMTTDMNGDGSAKIKARKIQLSETDCADTPTGYSSRYNIVLFNSSTEASPDFGSQACCTKYGYRWVPNSSPISGVTPLNVCKPLNQTTQPQ